MEENGLASLSKIEVRSPQKIIVVKGEYITWKRRIQIQTTRKLLG